MKAVSIEFSEVMATLREYTKPLAVTLVVVVLSFFLHWKWCGSSMNLSENIWQEMLGNHLTWYPFRIRYFTSYSVLFLHKVFLLPIRESFFLIQFPLLLVLGPVFYRYARESGFSGRQSCVGVFLLLSSYPVLCAYFEPVHTWDDVWTYLFVTLAVTSIMRSKVGAGMVFFTLGCFAREQTLIFYPIFVLASGWFSRGVSLRKKALWLLLPLIAYGVFRAVVWQDPDPVRFKQIHFNFEHSLRTRDTIFSLFISFGFIWLASTAALLRLVRSNRSAIERLLFWGTLIALPATLIVTLFFSRARETRILFPPFIFMVPLALNELILIHNAVKGKRGWANRMAQLAVFGLLTGVGFYLGTEVFPSFEYRACPHFAQQWAGLHFGLILNLVAFYATRIVTRYRARETLSIR